MSGTETRGSFESKLKAILADLELETAKDKGGVILFIDEIHQLLGLGKAQGSLDAGNMLKPGLARGLQLMGATTLEEYRNSIEKDAALSRRFQPVLVEEPTVEATISILRGLKSKYEVHHGISISDASLVTACVYVSDCALCYSVALADKEVVRPNAISPTVIFRIALLIY